MLLKNHFMNIYMGGESGNWLVVLCLNICMLYTLCISTSTKKQDGSYVHTYADDDSVYITPGMCLCAYVSMYSSNVKWAYTIVVRVLATTNTKDMHSYSSSTEHSAREIPHIHRLNFLHIAFCSRQCPCWCSLLQYQNSWHFEHFFSCSMGTSLPQPG